MALVKCVFAGQSEDARSLATARCPWFRLVRARGGHGHTPVAGDPLLAKFAQVVPYRPWPGLTASAGVRRLKSAEIRACWCQLWVSPAGGRFADPVSSSRSQVTT